MSATTEPVSLRLSQPSLARLPVHAAHDPKVHLENFRATPRSIDIHIDVPAVNYKELRGGASPEGSKEIRERVIRAREVQLNRFAAAGERIFSNSQMTSRQIRTYCDLSTDCERLLERAITQQGPSARAHDRILKVA